MNTTKKVFTIKRIQSMVDSGSYRTHRDCVRNYVYNAIFQAIAEEKKNSWYTEHLFNILDMLDRKMWL